MRADGSGARAGSTCRGSRPSRFPNVFAACRDAGLDPEHEPVPVSPAAHYLIGGVVTDLDARTSLAGLLAVGECACTGLHGANRLASNSLSECFVFGARAAAAALAEPPGRSTRRTRRAGASSRRPRPRGPPCGSTPGPCARGERLERLADDPYPLAALIAAAGPRATRIARAPTGAPTSRSPTRSSTGSTWSSARAATSAASAGASPAGAATDRCAFPPGRTVVGPFNEVGWRSPVDGELSADRMILDFRIRLNKPSA